MLARWFAMWLPNTREALGKALALTKVVPGPRCVCTLAPS